MLKVYYVIQMDEDDSYPVDYLFFETKEAAMAYSEQAVKDGYKVDIIHGERIWEGGR